MTSRSELLTAEEFGNILWPGMFPSGWRNDPPDNAWQQARFYCLEKAEELLKTIEVRHK